MNKLESNQTIIKSVACMQKNETNSKIVSDFSPAVVKGLSRLFGSYELG